MKKIKMVIVSVALVLSMLLSACGSTSNNSAADSKDATKDTGADAAPATGDAASATDSTDNGKPVKLTIWIAGTGDAIYDSAYRTVFDAYCKKHPNVSYELSFIAWADYFTKLNTGLIGGAGPDIFYAWLWTNGFCSEPGLLQEPG